MRATSERAVMERRPVITLLTDYGVMDEFVGVLHGVIATICPSARVIDVSHGIARHDVRGGAAVLAQSLPYMPVGVHLAVVDPTVGGDRRAVALGLADGRMLVGPDNGLLWPAAQDCGGVDEAVEVSQSPWRLEPVSPTFHGRDIFGPVAARLAAGESLSTAGESIDPTGLVRLEMPRAWQEGGTLVVSVTTADRFGNLQLGAEVADISGIGVELGSPLQVRLQSGETHPAIYARTFSDVAEDELIVFEDSAKKLAVGLNHGSAMIRLGVRAGDEVRIVPADAGVAADASEDA